MANAIETKTVHALRREVDKLTAEAQRDSLEWRTAKRNKIAVMEHAVRIAEHAAGLPVTSDWWDARIGDYEPNTATTG